MFTAERKRTVYHIHGAGGITFLMQKRLSFALGQDLCCLNRIWSYARRQHLDEAVLCKAKAEVVVDNCVEDPTTSVPLQY